MSRDITELKQAQAALEEYKNELEEKVAERTELAEARAKRLQKLAVEILEAEERERQRISELLHDDLQQLLASARIQLQVVSKKLPSQPVLSMVEQLLNESIEKSRRLSHELSPAVLQHSSLAEGLAWLARQMDKQFGLKIELETDCPQPFESAPLKAFVFRAVDRKSTRLNSSHYS